jgi:hypothetical protein
LHCTFAEMKKAMAEKEILYVTYKYEKMEEGLSYAIYLAGQIDGGLRVVLLERPGPAQEIGGTMAEISHVKASGHEAARPLLSEGDASADFKGEDGSDTASLYSLIMQKCSEEGVKVNIHTAPSGTVSAIKDFLKYKKIDMVLLSPEVTRSEEILRRIAKISPTPVVTMAR